MSEQEQPQAAQATETAEASPRKRISLRRAFFTGLAALLPTALSLVILVWIIKFINTYVAEPINVFIIEVMRLAGVENAADVFRHTTPEGGAEALGIVNFSFLGYVIAFGAVFVVGLMLLTFFGRRLYRAIDGVLVKVPVLRMIYPHVKQLTEFIFSDDKSSSFRRVVMIEYPRKGLWSLGFITGPAMRAVQEGTREQVVSVFVPSSPTPFTGYIVAIPREEVIELPITVDEALRFTVSGGVLVPPRQISRFSRAPSGAPGGETGSETRAPKER